MLSTVHGRSRSRSLHALLLILIFCAAPAAAQSYRPGAVLLEPIAARSIGLGNATTALGDDIGSLYANPAGLAFIDNDEVILNLGRSLARDFWSSAAGAVPIGRKGTIAVGIDAYRMNEEVGIARLDNDYRYRARPLGLDENSYVGRLAGARFIRRDLSIGAAATYIQFSNLSQRVLREDFQGLYGNFGLRYNSAMNGVVFGASLLNVGGRLTGTDPHDPDLPMTGSVGVSYGFLRGTAHYITLAADLVEVEREPLTFRVGAEYWWANVLGVRAGYDGTQNRRKENPYGGAWRGGLSASVGGAFVDLVAIPNSEHAGDFELAASLRFGFGPPRRR